MLVSYKQIIDMAEKGGYAIPAFNVYNLETVMGAVKAAEESKAPIILQCYARLLKEESGYYLAPIILAAAQKATVPVCFHLDHGPSELEMNRALRYGATGIMFDGSTYPFTENIALTKKAVEVCADVGVTVEGELGHIGSVNDDGMDTFTDPKEAGEFVKQTGVVSLAVLVGNAHGRYKQTPHIDIERIKAIRKTTNNIPLVLHGGSGIPDEQIKEAVKAGIRKMNVGTDVCYSFLDAVEMQLKDEKHSIAIDLFMKDPIEKVKEFCLTRIELLGAGGKANA